jgi:glycogen debranching enzyme
MTIADIPIEEEEAPPLDLPHCPEAGRLVLSRGNLFSVTAAAGNIVPAGARELGVFYQDTRHLSYYELRLDGEATLLSSDTDSAVTAQIDVATTHREQAGLVEEPINALHIRRKQLLDEEFLDQLVLTNHLARPIEVAFEILFAADFADLFEVRGARRPRRGRLLPARVDHEHVELAYRGTDGEVYRTILRFTPLPLHLEVGRALFRVRLEPGESQIQEVCVTPWRGEERPSRPPWAFDRRLQRTHLEAAAWRAECTTLRCDNALYLRALERAQNDIHALRILHGGRWIVGAGIPWFAAPFGRDSLITSAQTLLLRPALAMETLRFLAAWQGSRDDPQREEEPGKIFHELRRGELVRAGEVPHSPYYGSVDATPLFVVLLGELYRWTGDVEFLTELWPSACAALDWIERRTESGTRFLTYQRRTPRGLLHQGWKDSRDGVSFPHGRPAEPPIALVEVQGYVLEAYRHAATLAAAVGDAERSSRFASRIEVVRQRVEEGFYSAPSGTWLLAIDGEGRGVPTLASNPGHLLWSGAISEARAPSLASFLLSEPMYSGWGIRTVGRGQAIYNPISYHNGSVWPHDNAICALGMSRYHMNDLALRVLEGMFAAAEHFQGMRLPELFCGNARGDREFLVHYPVSCSPQAWASGALFMLLQACLGLDPEAATGRLRICNPRLPNAIRHLTLANMRVGESRVSLRFTRRGGRTHTDVLDVRGASLRVAIEVD